MSRPCADVRGAINVHFPFLADRGYRVIYEKDHGGGGCEIVLQGERLQIKLYSAPDEEMNLLVGSRSAQPEGGTGRDGDGGWYYLRGLVGFLDRDLTGGVRIALMTDDEWKESRANQVKDLSVLLSRNIGQIETLFSERLTEDFRRDYMAYTKDAARRTQAAYRSRRQGPP